MSIRTPRPRWTWTDVAAWLAIAALYLAVRVPLLDVPLERDEGAFAVIGEAILRGEVPYRDVFDHKPPGVYYIYAAALPFIPHTARGVHLLLLIWNLATLLCVAGVAGALAGRVAARWAGLVFAIVSAGQSLQGFSTTSEMLLLLPLSASIWLTIAAGDRHRLVQLAIAGGLGAAACWIKQPAAAALVICPLLLVARSAARFGPLIRDLVAWLGGGLGFSLVVVALFAAAGALDGVWYWTITHNEIYAASAATDWRARLGIALPRLVWDVGAPIALGLLGCGLALWQRRPRAWVAPTLLVLSSIGALHSPFLYRHYFALLAPAVAIVAATGLSTLQQVIGAAAGRVASTAVAVGALAALLVLPAIGAPWYQPRPDPTEVALHFWGPQGFETAAALGDYLRAHTTPDERLFIYGAEPEVAFLAGRQDVNPYPSVYALTGAWPRQHEFQQRAWAAIEPTPPRYVLVSHLRPSLMRAPQMDMFLETHLRQLLLEHYDREGFFVEDAAGRGWMEPAPPSPVAGANAPTILMELWRRR